MRIEEKYNQVLSEIGRLGAERTRNKVYTSIGLTSNLDLLCDFTTEKLSSLLEEYLPDGDLQKMVPVKVIRTMEELLETIVFFCRNGIGGEADIENTEVMGNSFEWKYGMGGTGVQAALALQMIGCPSIVHLTDDSREVCDILNEPGIYVASPEGMLISTANKEQTQEQEIHAIIQFQKGSVIRLKDQQIVIPVSNRLILTKITVNETVPFYKPYFEYIENHAKNVHSNVISSFNCLQNETVLRDRLDYTIRHIESYRKGNPEGVVFFEDAHYHNKTIRDLCMNTLYPAVDIVSLNEEEFKYTLESYGIGLDMDVLESYVYGLNTLRSYLSIRKGVIIHTKDFSMYIGDKVDKDIEMGLICGNLLATAKAVNGWYGTLEQIQKLRDLPLSPKGIEFYNEANSKDWWTNVIIVPTRYTDKPKYTIGLGDSFVAGVQLCF